MSLDITICADWAPEDARRLLAECGDRVGGALARLMLARDVDHSRVTYATETYISGHRKLFRPRLRRQAEKAHQEIDQEWERRVRLLTDVARAHGIPVDREAA